MQKEAKARKRINDLLFRSGWRFFDDENGPANVALETHVKLKKKELDGLGEDFENKFFSARSSRRPISFKSKAGGTRKYTFRYVEKEGGQVTGHARPKEKFKLFDFFAVCEYFEEHFNYDEEIKLPLIRPGALPPPPLPAPAPAGYTNVNPDPLSTYIETPVPVYGMKIDRKFYEQFEEKVKQDETVRKLYERGEIRSAEEHIRTHLFDKPEGFFNLDKLRKAVQLDRRLTLREVIEKIFGGLDRFKSKDELLDEELAKFVSIHKPDAGHVPTIRLFFKAYVTDGGVRAIVDSPKFGRL